MSLATRCTSCGTIFRVVQDQLRVSEGWVRCGRCDAVFQASESLFDLERDTAPPWLAPATRAGADPEVVASTAPAPAPAPAIAAPAVRVAAREPGPSEPPASAEAALRALSAAAAASDATVDAKVDADAIVLRQERAAAVAPSRAPAAPAAPSRATAASARAVVAPAEALASVEAAPPGFVAQARRDAFWQRRQVRALLSVAALILTFTLLLQATQQFSDIGAARWPALRPALAPWCHWTGCSLAAPRRIDDILVESTSLTPAPGTGALQLAVGLRNRAGHAVALPSIDLSLTDTAGRLIARRSLQPRDFRVAAADLGPRAELPLRALVSAGDERVSGYTVEIFYP